MCKRKKKMKEFGGRPAGHKKAAWLLVACLLALLVAGALQSCRRKDGLTQEKKTAVVKIGFDSFEPYSSVDENGNYVGIDIELATEAFNRMGYQAEFQMIPWEEKARLLADGSLDCLWSCFTMNGRENDYEWAGPYLYSRQVVAVRSDSQIYALKDLEGKRAAAQATTKASGVFLHEIDSPVPQLKQVNCFSTTEELFAALRKGYVDAIAGHEAMITAFVKGGNGNYRLLEESPYVSELGVAFEKGTHQDLAERLTETLRAMEADGTITRIVEKYGLDAAKVVWKGAQK